MWLHLFLEHIFKILKSGCVYLHAQFLKYKLYVKNGVTGVTGVTIIYHSKGGHRPLFPQILRLFLNIRNGINYREFSLLSCFFHPEGQLNLVPLPN